MRFAKQDLDWAVGEGLIDTEKAETLWSAMAAHRQGRPWFNAAHVAHFAGALIVIAAMGWFLGSAWEALGGAKIFCVSGVYAMGFAGVGWRQWRRPDGRITGGVLMTVAVAIVPLMTYGLQRWLGIWIGGDPGEFQDFHHWIRSGWFTMEAATILVGLIALRAVRFPFLTAPVAFALWYMSMDLTPIIAGPDFDWRARKLVSIGFGLAMLAGGYAIDRRTQEDFAFWGYLFGLIAFWGGLTAMDATGEWSRFGYFVVNVSLIVAGVFLRRRTFLVFGGVGGLMYLGHLATGLFGESVLFSFVLTAFGVGVTIFGTTLQRHGGRWEQALASMLPATLRRLRPVERR